MKTKSIMPMEFNQKLQELRRRSGLTQEQLAAALFVSRTAVSKWESGRGYPNIDSLKAIAKFFSVTVDELLSGEEIPAAGADRAKPAGRRVRLIFGLPDACAVLLIFLPFFRRRSADAVRAVSLLGLNGISPLLRAVYFSAVIGMSALGIRMLVSKDCLHASRLKNSVRLSLAANLLCLLLFIISPQPYAASFLLACLLVKLPALVKGPSA